ncbi:MaoC family dehydratase [Azospirillum thermophilum]|uniref:Nodulation protein NodN n=1 Tax=Azospirillum thermophilum TaxID=2202148 RepID=A0A2S2CLY3_9PROT|nr:MaoC family dehydratase [Azospirillum thermophilum]AWK85317.1 nodulation protein NodN [Azospirillum thermophilum]
MAGRMSVAELEGRVGREIGLSDWVPVDQPRIDAFAEVTEDHQFIHVDPERARREGPFGGTIAHGFLVLSLLAPMTYQVVAELDGLAMSVNYGFDRLRFLAPVRAGSRIRGRFVLAELSRRTDRERIARFAVTVEVEGGDKPALLADWLVLLVLDPQTAGA